MFQDGQWQLTYFYESAARWWTEFEKMRQKGMGYLDLWTTGKTKSPTPFIIKAQAYIYLAWHDRGRSFAPEVTAKGWKGFYNYLNKARESLIEGTKLNVKDPHLYSAFLTVGTGLGFPDDQMNSLFEKGISIETSYYPIYYNRAISSLPRWGGEQGALEKFASRAASNSKEKDSEALYARIAAYVLDYTSPNTFLNYNFSYSRMKQ